MIEELLNTIYNGNYNNLDTNKTYSNYLKYLTKQDLIDYIGGYPIYGSKKEMLKQICLVCDGIDFS
jgi:hypothetical protein